MKDRIRQVVNKNAHLTVNMDSLENSSDLYSAGMTSHASVVLMLALENEFDLEFPSSLLNRSVFESIDSIAAAVSSIASPLAR